MILPLFNFVFALMYREVNKHMRVQELDFAFEDSLKPLWSAASAVVPSKRPRNV